MLSNSTTGTERPDASEVTIMEIDYGTTYFSSRLKDVIRAPIDILYVECGEGCEHHPYEQPEEEGAKCEKVDPLI